MTAQEWNTIAFPKLGIELPVYSKAFTVSGFEIKWYGILIMLGLALAVVYCFRRMKSFGIDEDRASDVVFFGFIGAIVGARLYYVLLNFNEFGSDPSQIFNLRSGGLAIYGGFIGAILAGGITAKVRKVRIMPMFDLAGMGFLIGQGIGRWGNFFNHECFGGNTTLPWGMTSPRIQSQIQNSLASSISAAGMTVDPSLPVHPCFLYESLWCIIGFLLLHLYSRHRKFDGELFFMYIGWYGLGRVFIEGLRTDSLMIGHLRVSQLVAGICVAAAIAAIVYKRNKIRVDGEYIFYKDTEESRRLIAEAEEKYKAAEEKRAAEKAAKAAKSDGDESDTKEENTDGTDN